MFKRLRRKIEKIFLAGLLVTVPTMLTFFLLRFLVNYINKVSAPFVKRFLHTSIPGIGFAATILIVLAIGFLGTNFIGRRLVHFGEKLLAKVPFVGNVYASTKQLLHTVISADKPFQQVVLVPYPMDGVYAIGFLTRKVPVTLNEGAAMLDEHVQEQEHEDPVVSVFIPTTPNFTSGLLVMFPTRDVIPLSLSVESGFRYLMTGGILTPKKEKVPDIYQLEEWELFLH